MIFLNRLQYKQNNKIQLIFTPLNTALRSAVGEFNRGCKPCLPASGGQILCKKMLDCKIESGYHNVKSSHQKGGLL